MGATQNIKPSFFGSYIEKNTDCEETFALDGKKSPEATLATVMMTRLYDDRVETKFNRLLLMSANDTVSSTYPLNRKITHLGRSRRNPIRIKDPLVSVRHLTVTVTGSSCVVNDLDSSNGTFINGERLVGGRVLNDGDEIMVGKTVLRFAARQANTSEQSPGTRKRRAWKFTPKIVGICAMAALSLLAVAAIVLHMPHSQPVKTAITQNQTQLSQRSTTGEPAAASIAPTGAEVKSDGPQRQLQGTTPEPAFRIQQALTDYAAGRLGSAMQTLKLLSVAGETTPVSLQARRILSLMETVRTLYVKAGQAQKEKKLSKAIETWDQLLAADMELIGERPSFYAAEAEKNVQTLTYEHALEAYRLKNNKKAEQLCRVILQINERHTKAQALLAKIQPKT